MVWTSFLLIQAPLQNRAPRLGNKAGPAFGSVDPRYSTDLQVVLACQIMQKCANNDSEEKKTETGYIHVY